MKDIVLTGDRPTGALHIGHYVGSLKKRVEIQSKFEKPYVIIADTQALTDNACNPQKVRDNVIEVALDYLAIGLKPELNVFFIQSLVPELAELTMFYSDFVTLSRLKRNPTVKNEMQQKNFGNEVPVGFLTYPISQAADITAFQANILPVGDDQLPMIEQTNEIVRHINRTFNTDILRECKPLLSNVTRLLGTDGQKKMGKSLNNAIYLKDSSDVIREKIMNMYTDPNHLHVEDPGDVEANPVFQYLDAFDPDQVELQELKAHYKRGGLGDVKVKRRLEAIMQQTLEPIRERRMFFEKDKAEVLNILKKGSEQARPAAANTLKRLKEVLTLVY